MKLKILKNKEEPLLSRNKIDAELDFDNAVPARKEVLQEIAKQTGSKPELIVVVKISPSFGSKKAKILAYSYQKEEDLVKIEEGKKLSRTGFNRAKPKAAAGQAAPEVKA